MPSDYKPSTRASIKTESDDLLLELLSSLKEKDLKDLINTGGPGRKNDKYKKGAETKLLFNMVDKDIRLAIFNHSF